MEKQTKIKIQLTQTDKIIEILGCLTLFSFWVMILISFSDLPEKIPIHYNALGEVDNYGKKSSVFLLPIIGTFLFIILTMINKNPENFNYKINITEENAEKQYTNATKMVRWLKFIVILVFFIIDYIGIQIAKGNAEGLGIYFLPLILGIVFIPIYFTYKASN